jgi:ubiquinone/menaquinone biosynthesis C-methylase UbiE
MDARPTTGEANIAVFDADTAENGGYRYTTNASLSSRMANARLSDVSLGMADVRGQSVLDIGCGDGTYTIELFDLGQPAKLHALEPAETAVATARAKAGSRAITFQTGSAYELPYADGAFDWAWMRGVLHHLDRPDEAIAEALRVARQLMVIEPNGYSPILKLLERFSPYHRAHDEKSFTAATLQRWVQRAGGQVRVGKFAGLVPMFCPDWMAQLAKTLEPAVEATPLVRHLGCAVYIFAAGRISSPAARTKGAA